MNANRVGAAAFQPGGRPLIAELYVGRTKMPRLSRQRWRWDVEWHRKDEGRNPGVFAPRWHVAGDFGYAHTRWGAWRAVRRAYTRRTAAYDGRHDQVQYEPEPEIPRGDPQTAQGPRRRP